MRSQLRVTSVDKKATQRLGLLLFFTLFGVSFVQLVNDRLDRSRYGLETTLPTAVNSVLVIRRDYISVPVGTFGIRRRLCSLDRNNFIAGAHWHPLFRQIPGFLRGHFRPEAASVDPRIHAHLERPN